MVDGGETAAHEHAAIVAPAKRCVAAGAISSSSNSAANNGADAQTDAAVVVEYAPSQTSNALKRPRALPMDAGADPTLPVTPANASCVTAPSSTHDADVSRWLQLDDSDAALVRAGGRAHVRLGEGDGRFVTVLRVQGELWALDAICYHAGGPLGLGDIEEAGDPSRLCVRCPWHHYLVDLRTGVKWHRALEMNSASGKLEPAGWKATKDPVQRVHEVQVLDDGSMYVRLNTSDAKFQSDRWAHREDCFRPMSQQANTTGGGDRSTMSPADGRWPRSSGEVFAAMRTKIVPSIPTALFGKR